MNELQGMPERDELGNAAIYYLQLLDEQERIKVEMMIEKEKLCDLFGKSNKKSIKIDGRVISYSNVQKKVLRIQKGE